MDPDTSTLFAGPIFRVDRLRYRASDGGVRVRDVVRHPGSVVIVPIVDPGHVCLIRNYRCAVEQTLWELPAGTREPHELPEETARRELQEETGYCAERWTRLHEFFPAPGILDERMSLFLAEGLTPGPPRREPGEEIENVILSWSELRRMVHDREFTDAKTLLGLFLVQAYGSGEKVIP
ncbi:MAG TPA: NUDIX hydrolase [Pirellulaceae bacterium]